MVQGRNASWKKLCGRQWGGGGGPGQRRGDRTTYISVATVLLLYSPVLRTVDLLLGFGNSAITLTLIYLLVQAQLQVKHLRNESWEIQIIK